jgi:hypothetical protein
MMSLQVVVDVMPEMNLGSLPIQIGISLSSSCNENVKIYYKSTPVQKSKFRKGKKFIGL